MNQDGLNKTSEFWNASPCGGQENFNARQRHRYSMEPWVPELLQSIASEFNGKNILEIGCGQGTDAIVLCSNLKAGSRYIAIDYSQGSIDQAIKAASEVTSLPVSPDFMRENAEALTLEDESIDCVYSIGVIHHTPDTFKALQEIHRVLKRDGKAYIAVYRVWSPKVIVAKVLRGLQSIVDRLTGKERVFYHLLYGRHADSLLGTMLLECFGVPYLKCYTSRSYSQLLTDAGFQVNSLTRAGYNIPFLNICKSKNKSRNNIIGYFYVAELRKANQHCDSDGCNPLSSLP
jgi:ubiquinone/menaquinone biosynthesis C-methylase UbiE